jgi:hypothetical protein
MYDTFVTLFKPPEPRYKFLRVSLELFLEGTLFNTRRTPDGHIHAIEVEGIPPDARIAAMCYDPTRHQVLVRVWSSEFPLLGDCEPAPEMDLAIRNRVYEELTPHPDGLPDGVDGEVVDASFAFAQVLTRHVARLYGDDVRVRLEDATPDAPAPAAEPEPEPKVKFREWL